MIKGLKKLHGSEPACRKRSDSDHLKFVIHRKEDDYLKFDFTLELNGIKSWAVPDVPSMDPLQQRFAQEDEIEFEKFLEENSEQNLTAEILQAWDKGNYLPIDDKGRILSEYEALKCLQEGVLKFFLQGKKLIGEFVLMKKGMNDWLLMKRHDEFALYNF
jgi:bifunctional non-homologous end joining protein LigD